MKEQKKSNLELIHEILAEEFISPTAWREVERRGLAWLFRQPSDRENVYERMKRANISLLR